MQIEKKINTVSLTILPGNEIRKKRKELRYSLRELSEITGISASFLAEVEKGNRNPSDENLIKISNALEINLNLEILKMLERRLELFTTEEERHELVASLVNVASKATSIKKSFDQV